MLFVCTRTYTASEIVSAKTLSEIKNMYGKTYMKRHVLSICYRSTAIWARFALVVLFGSCAIATQAEDSGEGKGRLNRLIGLLETKQPAIGIFSLNLSPRTAAWVASSNVDFVVIDLEHSPYDPSRLETYLLALTDKRQILQKSSLQANVTPIVRVPSAGREHLLFVIKQVLDLGPMGILVPHVDTAEDALAAVRAMRYPQPRGSAYYEPTGMRGVGLNWAARQWGLNGSDYAQRADLWPLNPRGEMVLWLMIETRQAVENIREIVRVPGIGGLFVGPTDLSFAMGLPRGHPEVEQAMSQVLAACREAGVPCGTFDPQVAKRLREGYQFLAIGSDEGLSYRNQEAVKERDEFNR